MGLTRGLLEATLVTTAVTAALFAAGFPSDGSLWEVLRVLAKAVTLSICCVVSFYYNDLYDLDIVRSFRDFASRLLQAFGLALILLSAIYYILPGVRPSTKALLMSIAAVLIVLMPLRALSYRLVRRGIFRERVLVLGRGPLASQILREIEARSYLGYDVVGVADDAHGSGHAPGAHPFLGPLEHVGKILDETRPNRIIVAMSERRARLPVRQLLEARMRGSVVEDGVVIHERLTGKIAIESITPSNLIFSSDFRKSPLDLAAGRASSLLVAVFGLIVCSPLFLLISLAIKLDSKGPLFFVQERLGMNSKRFSLIKFRTMRVADGPTSEWALDNSDRITRVGKWLRRFRLDELPQFVNILRGDMNLVGPRPHPATNGELFGEGIPYYFLRAAVRPGITGWAQIRQGYANNLEEETEKMRYDLYYIKHLSFWLDLRILFDTVKIVLSGRGAVGRDDDRAQAA